MIHKIISMILSANLDLFGENAFGKGLDAFKPNAQTFFSIKPFSDCATK